MAWIESHQVLDRHPKVLMLMSLMKWDKDTTIGKLHRFWWWCVDYAEDGNLEKYNADQIGSAIDIPSGDEALKFKQNMLKAGWLDLKPYLRVHDWWKYIGRFLQVKYKIHPEKWQAIRELYINNPPNNGCNNHIPNLTIPNLTKPNTKQPYWAGFNKEIQDRMTFVSKTFNIYRLLGKVKKDRKVEIPEEVINKICKRYLLAKSKIKAEWPWFVVTLQREWENWNAEKNIAEGAEYKAKAPMPQSIKDLVAMVLKSKDNV